jgi:hypothetical protein
MKKENRTILIIPILFILISFFIFVNTNSFCQNTRAPQIKKSETPIQVKIPDGLYLYKPNFGEDSIFSPLVLVENRKLVDPYALAQKMGFQAFLKKYVKGKTFNVYVGSELFGKLSHLDLKSISTKDKCQGDDFVPDIQGKGQYEGKPLPYGWIKEEKGSGYLFRVYGSTKILITPESFQMTKKPLLFPVTDADMEQMVEAVRKNLVPGEIDHINKYLAKENRRVIGESGSRLRVAEAFDLDGNGKKDLIGVYYLHTVNNQGGSNRDILFILWDTGKVEKITFGDNVISLILSGTLDIDQDGLQELIIPTILISNPDSGDRRQINILRDTPIGWVNIYYPKWVCDAFVFWVSD